MRHDRRHHASDPLSFSRIAYGVTFGFLALLSLLSR